MEKREHYRVSTEEQAVSKVRALYEDILSKREGDEIVGKVEELMSLQKNDGSFSVIDDYKVDGDIVVAYVLEPTYFATAALIHAVMNGVNIDIDHLLKGLQFASGRRGFFGHGFEATSQLIDALNIYKKAGAYRWIKDNESKAPKFAETIKRRIAEMKSALATGRTFSDWERDFSTEFRREVKDFENEYYDHMWYVAYGSNINKDRFMQYINNCTDTTPPIEDKAKICGFTIYFAGDSTIKWGDGGVAYLDDTRRSLTYCRMYKITPSQFAEIQSMEGGNYQRKIDLDPFMEGDCPCYTFTSDAFMKNINEPSERYFSTIMEGLKETYPDLSEKHLKTYLISKCVKSRDTIWALMMIRTSKHAKRIGDICGFENDSQLLDAIKNLDKIGLIKEDKRSVRRGLDITDPDALVYTTDDMREIADLLIMGSNEKTEVVS